MTKKREHSLFGKCTAGMFGFYVYTAELMLIFLLFLDACNYIQSY